MTDSNPPPCPCCGSHNPRERQQVYLFSSLAHLLGGAAMLLGLAGLALGGYLAVQSRSGLAGLDRTHILLPPLCIGLGAIAMAVGSIAASTRFVTICPDCRYAWPRR